MKDLPKSMIEMSRPFRRVRPAEKKIPEALANECGKLRIINTSKAVCLVLFRRSGKIFYGLNAAEK
jgi:hypothetical protein